MDMPRTKTSACRSSVSGTEGTRSRTSGCSLACTGASHSGRSARSTVEPRRRSAPVRARASCAVVAEGVQDRGARFDAAYFFLSMTTFPEQTKRIQLKRRENVKHITRLDRKSTFVVAAIWAWILCRNVINFLAGWFYPLLCLCHPPISRHTHAIRKSKRERSGDTVSN